MLWKVILGIIWISEMFPEWCWRVSESVWNQTPSPSLPSSYLSLQHQCSTTHIRPLALSQIQVCASCLHVPSQERVSAHNGFSLHVWKTVGAVWFHHLLFEMKTFIFFLWTVRIEPRASLFSTPKVGTCARDFSALALRPMRSQSSVDLAGRNFIT